MRTGSVVLALLAAAAGAAWGGEQGSPAPVGAAVEGLLNSESPVAVPDPGACGDKGPTPCPSPDQGGAAGAPAAAPASAGILPAGAAARAFALKSPKGEAIPFDPAKLEKPRLLVFWSVFCEPCKEELPMVGWVADKYAGEGFGVLGVNLDGESMAMTAERFLKMNQLTFPTVMDRKEKKRFLTAAAYGVTGTPSLFLVGADGVVRWSRVGRVEVSDLEAAVRASLGL